MLNGSEIPMAMYKCWLRFSCLANMSPWRSPIQVRYRFGTCCCRSQLLPLIPSIFPVFRPLILFLLRYHYVRISYVAFRLLCQFLRDLVVNKFVGQAGVKLQYGSSLVFYAYQRHCWNSNNFTSDYLGLKSKFPLLLKTVLLTLKGLVLSVPNYVGHISGFNLGC